MPIYADLPEPKFSQGWLSRWKARYKIKKYALHGESGSAEAEEETENMMQEIQEILSDYERKDIYNMDETVLYWKRALNITLATKAQEGIKQDKTFQGIIRDSLGCSYQLNATAWNNSIILKE